MEQEAVRPYELILAMKENNIEQLEQTCSEVEGILEKYKGNLKERVNWGSKKMFHTKHENCYYYYLTFSSPVSSVQKIYKEIQLNTEIVKSFIAKAN